MGETTSVPQRLPHQGHLRPPVVVVTPPRGILFTTEDEEVTEVFSVIDFPYQEQVVIVAAFVAGLVAVFPLSEW